MVLAGSENKKYDDRFKQAFRFHYVYAANEEVSYSSLFVEEWKHFIELGKKDGYAFFT